MTGDSARGGLSWEAVFVLQRLVLCSSAVTYSPAVATVEGRHRRPLWKAGVRGSSPRIPTSREVPGATKNRASDCMAGCAPLSWLNEVSAIFVP